MSENVVSLSERRPHATGDAICLDCKHVWSAVAPLGTKWLECPSCSLVRGRFRYQFERHIPTWECKCGNDLFYVTREGIYCPNCGVWQEFPR